MTSPGSPATEINRNAATLEAAALELASNGESAVASGTPAAEATTGTPSRASRYALHPAFRDLGLFGATSVITTIAAVAIISLLGRYLGPALLGEYLLVRRVASWLQSVVVLPSGIALPRYVAASVKESGINKRSYFFPALLIGSALSALISICLIFGRVTVGRFLLGSGDFAHLLVPISVTLVGLALHTVVFGYYQGDLSMIRASIIQALNLAVVPFACAIFLWRFHSISLIVDATGVAIIAISGIFALPIALGMTRHIAFAHFTHRSSELIHYGSSRMVGDFGLQALLSLPALIAAHFVPIAAVSSLLLGGSFLGVVSVATLPLGLILLSRVSRSIASNRSADLRERVEFMMAALVDLSTFVSLQMLVFSDVILKAWVGSRFLGGLLVVQIAIMTVPFYFLYSGLRSLVDAGAVKAYNTRNIIISLVAFLLASAAVVFAARGPYFLEALAFSGMFGLFVLSCLTWQTTQKLFAVQPKWKTILPGFLLALAAGFASYAIRKAIPFAIGLPLVAGIEVIITLAFFLGLHWMRAPWLVFVRRTALPGFGSAHPHK